MSNEITKMVRGENTADFEYYHDGSLWYRVMYMDDDLTPKQFLFPVQVEDIGNATFHRNEKALLLMRYIRKHMKTIEEKEN